MKVPLRLRLYLFVAIAIPAFTMPSEAQNNIESTEWSNWKFDPELSYLPQSK